jgi:adenylate kinase family enzyme
MDDDLVLKLIEREVEDDESRKGVILDGFPKTV